VDPGQYFMAMVRAYDGRDDDATRHLVAAIEKGQAGRLGEAWQDAPHRPILAHLVARPEVQEAIRRRQAALDVQRAEVLEMLCGPNPVSKNYRPAPETCAKARSP
jgi:hypothetical protein